MLGDVGVSVGTRVTVRNLFALALLTVIFGLFHRQVFRIQARHLPIFLGAGILSVLGMAVAYFQCQMLCSLAVAGVLLYLAPSFVVLMSAALWHAPITKRKLAALALAPVSYTHLFVPEVDRRAEARLIAPDLLEQGGLIARGPVGDGGKNLILSHVSDAAARDARELIEVEERPSSAGLCDVEREGRDGLVHVLGAPRLIVGAADGEQIVRDGGDGIADLVIVAYAGLGLSLIHISRFRRCRCRTFSAC